MQYGVAEHGRIMAMLGASRGGPKVPLRVVEVDDEADAPVRHPYADADPVVHRVHQVHVVPAAVGAFALEEAMATEHRAVGIARAAAEVLAPAVAVVSSSAQTVAWVAAAEVGAHVVDGELLGVRP